MADTINVLVIGDIVGGPGLQLCKKWLPILQKKYAIDATIVNGENAAKEGKGIGLDEYRAIKESGATVITTGNHAWDKKDIYATLQERDDIVRPINYPAACPGKGYAFFFAGDYRCAVINLHGRVFIPDSLDCPFKAIESTLSFIRTKTNIIFVDFHAEASSEKKTMGRFLDGKVSGVWGTHTHVQTADDMIFPHGTAYITDVGSCGALYSVIGFEYEQILQRMTQHHRFGKLVVDEKGPLVLNGLVLRIDPSTGKALSIERLRIIDEDIVVQLSAKK